MAMVWRSVLTLSLAATLSAQGPPTATVDFGAYSESVSNGNGLWQGLLLDGSWDPYKNGKFIGSVISFDRPTGCGVMESVGKYQEFHGGFGFLGLGTSQGAAYLPTLQVVTDLDLEVPLPGLLLGGGLILTRVRDGHQDWQAALGPTLYAGSFISTLRLALNRSFPGGYDSTSTMVTIRHGVLDYRAWQSLHLNWGTQSYQNLIVNQGVQARGMEAGADCFIPFGHGWTLQPGLEWARVYGQYQLWGASLRFGRMF